MITVEQLAARLGWSVEYAEHVVGCEDCGPGIEGEWTECFTWQLITGQVWQGPITREEHAKWEERKDWPLSRLLLAAFNDAFASVSTERGGIEYYKPIKATLHSAPITVSREALE